MKHKLDSQWYCLLPKGNTSEFPQIDKCLRALKVASSFSRMSAGGRIYRVERSGRRNLPSWKRKKYLPVSIKKGQEHGHSIWRWHSKLRKSFMEEVKAGEWVIINKQNKKK